MSYIITQTADELPSAQFLIAYGPDGPRWTDLRANARQYDTREAAETVLNKLKQLPDAEAVTLDVEPYEQAERASLPHSDKNPESGVLSWKRWKIGWIFGLVLCVNETEKRIGYIDKADEKKLNELWGTIEEQVTLFCLKLRDRILDSFRKRWNDE